MIMLHCLQSNNDFFKKKYQRIFASLRVDVCVFLTLDRLYCLFKDSGLILIMLTISGLRVFLYK